MYLLSTQLEVELISEGHLITVFHVCTVPDIEKDSIFRPGAWYFNVCDAVQELVEEAATLEQCRADRIEKERLEREQRKLEEAKKEEEIIDSIELFEGWEE
jgi:hypothetical protein